MCDPLMGAALMSVGGSVVSSMFAPSPPSPQAPPEPPPPPQEATSPDANVSKSKNAQQMAAGPASTMLTGPQGVLNDTLNLGKSTLLGQ